VERRLTIRCHHCGRPIATRDELRVAGRLLRPFHAACHAEHSAAARWYRRPGWALNRWTSFLRFDALLLALLAIGHLLVRPIPAAGWKGIGGLLLLANAWLLLARAVSYWSLERHLPRATPFVDGRSRSSRG